MAWIHILLWLLTFKLVISEECPPQEDIQRCFCYEKGSEIFSICSRISSLEQLLNAVNGFQGKKIFSFAIMDSVFDYLPYNIFENTTIKHLTIAKSHFSRIGNLGEPQFYGLETSLESLTFKNTFTKSHPFAYVAMEHLTKLKTLDLSSNHVEVVHNEWFKTGPESLEVVRFVKGEIRVVAFRAFNILTNLKIIDVSDNTLTYLTRSALPEPALHLEELNLERNKLETLPEDIFHDMPNLKRVNLELNEFATIDESIWGSVWDHLHSLNIDYNPMICDSKIKWIYGRKNNLEQKLTATCYKPFTLMERDLHSLKLEELQ